MCECAYHCVQLQYAIQHRALVIILLLSSGVAWWRGEGYYSQERIGWLGTALCSLFTGSLYLSL